MATIPLEPEHPKRSRVPVWTVARYGVLVLVAAIVLIPLVVAVLGGFKS